MLNIKNKIIVALDVDTSQHAAVITNKLDGLISFYKIGWQLFMSEGMDIVHRISNDGYKVFLDLKIDDIPNTVEKATSRLPYIHNLEFMTLQGDDDTFLAAVKGNKNITYLNVPILSSRNIIFEHFFLKLQIKPLINAGCNGFILSGDRIKVVRDEYPDVLIVSPGIRLDGDTNEHKKFLTPKEAFDNGSDYVILGRPIVNAKNPADVIKRIEESVYETT